MTTRVPTSSPKHKGDENVPPIEVFEAVAKLLLPLTREQQRRRRILRSLGILFEVERG